MTKTTEIIVPRIAITIPPGSWSCCDGVAVCRGGGGCGAGAGAGAGVAGGGEVVGVGDGGCGDGGGGGGCGRCAATAGGGSVVAIGDGGGGVCVSHTSSFSPCRSWACSCCMTSRLASPPHSGGPRRLAAAQFFLSSADHSSDPTAPSAGVGRNATSATSAVLTDHEGCQCSGWCCDIVRHTLTLVSNRPLGVNSRNAGGLNGYSDGRMMRPW